MSIQIPKSDETNYTLNISISWCINISNKLRAKTNTGILDIGLGLSLLVFVKQFLSFGISKDTTSNDIDRNECNKRQEEYNISLPPLILQALKQTSLARITTITKLSLVIVPLQTIHVSSIVYRHYPICWVHKCVSTQCWWLAAS